MDKKSVDREKMSEESASASESEVEHLPTWEDDESRSTLALRSAVVLVSGALLLWTLRSAPLQPAQDWNRWIWATVLCSFVLPLAIVWLLFGQGLSHLGWLKDQKHNAWSYGWRFGEWKKHLKIGFIFLLVLLPLLWFYARSPEVRGFYQNYYPADRTAGALLVLIVSTVVYMFCWEWFFRGYLLFGLAQGFGFIVAILLQAALFGAAHWGKPPLEMYSSFLGGALLGAVCWREKSFLPAFYGHALIHIVWILLIFYS